mmetsp:Transcript_19252/g.48170  ORF Transcript_19252/g.48170 Transcript_19252/m.48170 type:complete len:260 (+) Transcript_19252:1759-2538(+)
MRAQIDWCNEEVDRLETLNLDLGANLLPELYEQIELLTSDRAFLFSSIQQYFNGKMMETIDLLEEQKIKEFAGEKDQDGGKTDQGEGRTTSDAEREEQLLTPEERLHRENKVLKQVLWRLGPANLEVDARREALLYNYRGKQEPHTAQRASRPQDQEPGKMLSTSTQTDHWVLQSERLLESEVLQLMDTAYKARLVKLKRVQGRKLRALVDANDDERVKHTAIFTKLVRRLLQGRHDERLAENLTTHLLQCKELRRLIE